MLNFQTLVPEHLVRVVLWLAAIVLAIDLVMVLYIFLRRMARRRYFDVKDAATKKYSEPVGRFLAGEIDAEQLAPLLRNGRSRAVRDAIQGLLMGSLTESNRPSLAAVLLKLGIVDRWAADAFGKRRAREIMRHLVDLEPLPPARKPRFERIRQRRLFCVARAAAVAQLGQLDPQYAQVFMNEAMRDPSSYVGRANVSAMGRNREAFQVTVLLELLRQSTGGVSHIPVLSVKTALVRYPVAQLEHFVPFLADPDARFRFLVVDSIREICDAAPAPLSVSDFPETLLRWFLNHAPLDGSIDVRARSARVLRHFHDPRATAALRALLLDPDEFVRLHTVRACADRYYTELLQDIVRRMTDDRWRVREASVKTLAAFGMTGRQQLAQGFLDTSDRYASEQIAEEMQRGGIVAEMLPALGSANGNMPQASNVFFKLVRMGKTSLLTDLLTQETRMSRWGDGAPASDPKRARERLLDILLVAPTAHLMDAMRTLADRKTDELSARARSLLQSGSVHVPIAPERSNAATAGGKRSRA
ncbi:MAG TPA: HEAT repeat domain-containing protein [Candidatus Angelobacter sp.]|nr:HEAT repeat domain-containing protein [Candidatus Angelobacter sp.]